MFCSKFHFQVEREDLLPYSGSILGRPGTGTYDIKSTNILKIVDFQMEQDDKVSLEDLPKAIVEGRSLWECIHVIFATIFILFVPVNALIRSSQHLVSYWSMIQQTVNRSRDKTKRSRPRSTLRDNQLGHGN